MKKQVTRLFNDFKSGKKSRRCFLKQLAAITGSSTLASALLPVLEENEFMLSKKEDRFNIISDFIKYPGFNCEMRAFMARPAKGKKFPAVIVIHENRGLVPHIQDVTKRMAREGFLTIAPDALTPLGGTPDDVSNVGALFKQLNYEDTVKNFVAAVKYLKTNPFSTGKVGCTGFCWGGAMTNQVAVNAPDLNAAVPYYGRQPAAEDVEKIKAPLMAHYAENDPGINSGIQTFEEALKKYGKDYQIFIYEGTGHAFNNDTNPERYNEKAAKLAWERTVSFFKEKLKS